MSTSITRSSHTLSPLDGEIVEESELGSMRRVTADNLPIFDQPVPADIGYRASASAYSREDLAAAFNTHIDDMPTFPFTPADPLVVGRVNPVDPR
ncbi:MAG: oxalate decarboxylase [Mycobacterium sp.]|nr:oxalate decarboxylase [Mycobacterium sp.]